MLTDDMIEKAARAIYVETFGPAHWFDTDETGRALVTKQAKAALTAVIEDVVWHCAQVAAPNDTMADEDAKYWQGREDACDDIRSLVRKEG